MAKRSASKGLSYKRSKKDFYRTPYEAVLPLLAHLPNHVSFVEPCAGAGHLIGHLERHGHDCQRAYDIAPAKKSLIGGIEQADALQVKAQHFRDYYITNPPWSRPVLHALIEHLRVQRATWLLFDADWKYTVQMDVANKYGVQTVPQLLAYCHKIVAVGRVNWIENTGNKKGMDNAAWYLFTDQPNDGAPKFYPIGWKGDSV